MATSSEYVTFVCEQIHGYGDVRCRKMFSEYMVYLNDKPIFTVCDNTVYVKQLPVLADLLSDAQTGSPYDGAKPHYLIDPTDASLLNRLVPLLEAHTPVPAKRAKKAAAPEK
ncbi:MAG: hypothetical protein MR018_06435 [Clostridiales bacterium]|nr:hypothetical protein [Clostridiales bacterium]